MKSRHFYIDGIPAVTYGNTSDKVYLYLHGQFGCKEEAQGFGELAETLGWQVIGIDLPGHGERKGEDTFYPWYAVPELERVMKYIKNEWPHIALYAGSIGAWFGLLSYSGEHFHKCLFSCPLIDMSRVISNMMNAAGVSEAELEMKKEITTVSGEILSWKYYRYAAEHPINTWNSPTSILYASDDKLIDRDTVETFADRFGCRLDILENSEHWIHTPEQVEGQRQWMKRELIL